MNKNIYYSILYACSLVCVFASFFTGIPALEAFGTVALILTAWEVYGLIKNWRKKEDGTDN